MPNAETLNLQSFRFDDKTLSDDETLLSCVAMFKQLDLIKEFEIDYKVIRMCIHILVVMVMSSQTLCSWLTTVKRNYRAVAYHNWRHAFNVAQTMFAIITVSVAMV